MCKYTGVRAPYSPCHSALFPFPLLTLQRTWPTHWKPSCMSGCSDMSCKLKQSQQYWAWMNVRDFRTEWHASTKTFFSPPTPRTSPSLWEDAIISTGTNKSRSASIIPKGSSWATWCPRICNSSGFQERQTGAIARRRERERGDSNPKESKTVKAKRARKDETKDEDGGRIKAKWTQTG